MKSRTQKPFILLVILSLLIPLIAACTDDSSDKKENTSSEKVTIGLLSYLPSTEGTITNFKDEMTKLGYVEGEKVEYLYDGVLEPTPEVLDPVIQAMVDKKVNLIIAFGTPLAQRAKIVTEGTNIPVLFGQVVNPVGAGLLENPQKPGGNITGIDVGTHIIEKSVEWLLNIAPEAKNIYVPVNVNSPATSSVIPLLHSTTEKLNIELVELKADNLEQGLAELDAASADIDAFFILPVFGLGSEDMTAYIDAVHALNVPTGSNYPYATAGTTIVSVAPNFGTLPPQLARMADQIIKFGNVGDIPVEQIAFNIDINLAAAEQAGIEISDNLLQQVTNIYRELPTPQPSLEPTEES